MISKGISQKLGGIVFFFSIALCSQAGDRSVNNWRIRNLSALMPLANHLARQKANKPLFYAAGRGDLAAVKQLIASGADVNERDENGWTPLFAAMTNKKETPQIIEALIRAGADINATDHEGNTALLRAIGPFGTHANIKALLASELDINRSNHSGDTAITLAAGWDDTETVRMLLQKKANPNASRKDGNSGLMIAAKLGHDEVVRLLLVGGANANEKNAQGKTALMLAEEDIRLNKSANAASKRRLKRITLLLRQAEG